MDAKEKPDSKLSSFLSSSFFLCITGCLHSVFVWYRTRGLELEQCLFSILSLVAFVARLALKYVFVCVINLEHWYMPGTREKLCTKDISVPEPRVDTLNRQRQFPSDKCHKVRVGNTG